MAAGSFIVSNVWKQEMGTNGGGMSSATFYANLTSASRSPTLADLSSTAIIDVISGVSGYAQQTITTREWSSSVAGTYRFDCADFAFTTSAVMTPKYCVLTRKSDGKHVGHFDLTTASAAGTDCTQASITVPGSGMFTLSG